MAKVSDDPKVIAFADKQAAAAVKAEQKRVAANLKALEMPEGTTARQGAAIKKAIKLAIVA